MAVEKVVAGRRGADSVIVITKQQGKQHPEMERSGSSEDGSWRQ